MSASIFPDSIAVGQVETFRVLSSLVGQTFMLSVDNPAGQATPIIGPSGPADGTRFTFFADEPGDFIVTAQGSLGDVAVLQLTVKAQPFDLVEFERQMAQAVCDIVQGVPYIGPCYPTERYPESGLEDEALTTTPDPVAPVTRITNYLEVGIPTVAPAEVSGRNNTRFRFVYPLSYTLGVKDSWAKDGFPYHSSGEMFIATYLHALRALAQKRTLGFVNVWCDLLQQETVGTLTNEDGEALSHYADWSLVVTADRPL